jgi:hypothetical protein
VEPLWGSARQSKKRGLVLKRVLKVNIGVN